MGPLVNNGGPTLTHFVPSGSPVINAGDPSVAFNAGEFDQRGAPFVRVFGGRIDMGATESQPTSGPALPGDYNQNNIVDTADYTVWRDTRGSTTVLRADGDGDGTIDSDDYSVWKSAFGNTLSLAGTNSALHEGLLATRDARALALAPRVATADVAFIEDEPAEPTVAVSLPPLSLPTNIMSRERSTRTRGDEAIKTVEVSDAAVLAWLMTQTHNTEDKIELHNAAITEGSDDSAGLFESAIDDIFPVRDPGRTFRR